MHAKRVAGCVLSLCAALLLAPVQCGANIAVSGSLTHSHKTVLGGTVSGVVEIVNYGDTVAEARLYLKDYVYWANGAARYSEPRTKARSNARWIVLRSELVSVPPKGVVGRWPRSRLSIVGASP